MVRNRTIFLLLPGPHGTCDGTLLIIVKVKGGYKVVSTKGENLGGPYKTKEEAKRRLHQVEFFKHRKG